jgi:hypothetical protein
VLVVIWMVEEAVWSQVSASVMVQPRKMDTPSIQPAVFKEDRDVVRCF